MIKPIKFKIAQTKEYGLLHDSRSDINRLALAMSEIITKLNEVISKVNELDSKKNDKKI